MTIDSKIVFDPAEIKAVIFECSTCGTRIAASAQKMDRPPEACPLGHAWNWNRPAGYESTESPFRAFLSALANLQRMAYGREVGFRVLLEIDGAPEKPKS